MEGFVQDLALFLKKNVWRFIKIYVLLYFRGPMVSGIPPREASDRLGIFQARFDELWRKYETYSGKFIIFGRDFK